MAKKDKIKTVKAAPIKSNKVLERQYQKQLNKLGKSLIVAVRKEVLTYLKAHQSSYVSDGLGDQLGLIFKQLNAIFTGTAVAGFAEGTASQMVEKVGTTNKKKFDRVVERATGVDLGAIVTAEGLEDFIELSVNKNVSLIKSLPEEYLKQVETIVNNGVVSGARYTTIEKEIISKTGASAGLANRIKLIARNEVSTINAQINKRRSEALGIKKGIWRTSEDERVRGNPSGKYPNAKPSHFKLNGEEFDLSKGMKVNGEFIFPGIPINCRCSYSPIIEVR